MEKRVEYIWLGTQKEVLDGLKGREWSVTNSTNGWETLEKAWLNLSGKRLNWTNWKVIKLLI